MDLPEPLRGAPGLPSKKASVAVVELRAQAGAGEGSFVEHMRRARAMRDPGRLEAMIKEWGLDPRALTLPPGAWDAEKRLAPRHSLKGLVEEEREHRARIEERKQAAAAGGGPAGGKVPQPGAAPGLPGGIGSTGLGAGAAGLRAIASIKEFAAQLAAGQTEAAKKG